jgi:hypothetical protein
VFQQLSPYQSHTTRAEAGVAVAAKAPMDKVVAAIAANAIFFKFIVIFGAPIPDRSPYPRA